MNCIGQTGRGIVYGLVLAAAPAICSAQTAGANGGAKISAPVVSGVADPFVNATTPATTVDSIPTPIMTSSGRVAEASPAVKPIATKSPLAAELPGITPSSAPAPATKVIDAGKLVPLSSPAKPQAIRVPTSDDKLTEAAPAGLKPIQPAAAITRETVTAPNVKAATKTQPAATKKPAAKPKPVEQPSEQIAPAVNFSFPQPVIPLESALRKLRQWTQSRR